MELSILDSSGLPDGSILSVRSGPTRRQSPLPCVAPFRLPAGPWPLRIDVLALLGKSHPGASLAKLQPDGCCQVPLEARDGRAMSVTLQVFEGKGACARPKTAPNFNGRNDSDEPEKEASPCPAIPARRRDTEAEARAYLDQHRLHEFMHALFELLLRERPTDPYSFIAARFREAARQEPHTMSKDLEKIPCNNISIVPAIRRESPSTYVADGVIQAPRNNSSIVPATRRESPSTHVDGVIQVAVRSLRGRSLARLCVHPTETVGAVKQKLAACLGVPAASQQLLWWAEMLPNYTTLEDHGVTAGGSLNLVCGVRDPQVRHCLSGSSDGSCLKLWNLEDGELIREFGGTITVVVAMVVEWSSMRALTGSFDGRLHLWDLKAGAVLAAWDGHSQEVVQIIADWPSMRAVSGACDGVVKLWNMADHTCLQLFTGEGIVQSLAVDWEKMRAFVAFPNGIINLWDMLSGSCLQEFNCTSGVTENTGSAVSVVLMDCIDYRVVSGLDNGHIIYSHLRREERHEDKQSPKMFLAHYSSISSMVARWGDTDSQVLCGSDDGSLSLWSLETQECSARFSRHIGFVWAIHADWARNRVVSGAFDGCIKLWDLRNGECLRTLQSHSRPVRSICVG